MVEKQAAVRRGDVFLIAAAAKDVGVDVAEAASAAANGAFRAAGSVSAGAGEQVRNALTGTISGVKVVLQEPFKKQG